MANLKDIISFCNTYLSIDQFSDSSYNGLQIEGRSEVGKIGLGVSCNIKLFEKAKKDNCDLIITHHGLLWNKRWQYIVGFQKKRIKFLLDNNISLAAYHLPLDAHPEIGNNAVALKKLGAKILGKFDVGYTGKLKINYSQLKREVDNLFNTKSRSYGTKKEIETVAFVSGGGRFLLEDAMRYNIDVFITGEVNESVPALVLEEGINYIAAGHYNTEKFGVIALGNLLEKKFKIITEFIDIPNDL